MDLEELRCYPFGLTMSGISSKALAFCCAENKKKFNGIEQTTELDLNQYDASYRTFDPQIGRFWQLDPLAEMADSWSPYVFASNNPILRNDPLGLKDSIVNGEHVLANVTLENATVASRKKPGAVQTNSPIYSFNWQGSPAQNQPNYINPFQFDQLNYTPVPKNYKKRGLPGFPETGPARKHPESNRWRWYDKDGKILEWDSEKGEVEKYDKSGKPGTHHELCKKPNKFLPFYGLAEQ